MEALKNKSTDAQIREMEVGETLTFPLSKYTNVSTSTIRAKDKLAPVIPVYEIVKFREKALLTIKRIR